MNRATIFGITKPSRSLELHPSGDIIIETGDILVLIGESEDLERLEDITRL